MRLAFAPPPPPMPRATIEAMAQRMEKCSKPRRREKNGRGIATCAGIGRAHCTKCQRYLRLQYTCTHTSVLERFDSVAIWVLVQSMASSSEHLMALRPVVAHNVFMDQLAAIYCPEIDEWSDADKKALQDFKDIKGAKAKWVAFLAEGGFYNLQARILRGNPMEAYQDASLRSQMGGHH